MSDAFPFTSIQSTNATTSLPMFREWAYDFNEDKFLRDSSGNMILLEGNEALKVWLYKLMKTERWAYLAYSDSYGIELHQFFGKVLTVGERKSELRRVIKEAIMVNPYVTSIDGISFVEDEHGRIVSINITLTTIYGTLEI